MTLTFIVNGEDVQVECRKGQTVHAAKRRALKQSHNTGRPAFEWQVRDVAGRALSEFSRVGTKRVPNLARLFLTLQVGVGGNTGILAAA